MDTKRLLFALILSIGFLLLWGRVFPPPEPAPSRAPQEIADSGAPDQAPARPVEPSATASGAESEARDEFAPSEMTAAEPEAADVPVEQGDRERIAVIDAPTYRAELTNRGGQLISFRLKEHANSDGEPLDLVRSRESQPYPFGLYEAGGEPSPLNDALFVAEESMDGARRVLSYRYNGPAGRASKRFVFGDDQLFEVEIRQRDGRTRSVLLGPGIRNPTAKELDNRFARKSAVYQTPEDTELIDPQGESEAQLLPGNSLRWVGLQDTYFLTALVFKEPVDQVLFEPVLAEFDEAGGPMRFRPRPEELTDEEEELIREMDVRIRPSGDRFSAVAYWGPKIYDDLADLDLGLEKAVALGPFGFLARPLLTGLRWIYSNVVSNYGWAIILMTLAIRIALFPLNHKSVVSMQRMQDLNPKIQSIRQKYRSKLKDKQGRPNSEMQRKQNEEIMALYKKEGVNPAGGCLPLLLQIPVLFAFYSLLSTAIELRYAPWTGWIHDLAAPDPFYALPIVMGATQFLQQKLTPSAADPAQRRIFMLMPIFFTILFLGFPSGLVLYWLTNNVLGIVQQVAYKRLKERKAEAAA